MSPSSPPLPSFISSSIIPPPLAPSQIPLSQKYLIAVLSFITWNFLYVAHRRYFNNFCGTSTTSSYESTHKSQVFISLLHSIISSVLSIWYLLHTACPPSLHTYAPLIVTNYEYPVDYVRRFVLQMTLGYMVYDLMAYLYNFFGMLQTKEEESSTFSMPRIIHTRDFKVAETAISMVHHVIIIAAYSTSLYNHVASFPEIALMSAELSTPFLHTRYFMRQSPYWSNSIFYSLIQLVFVVIFFVTRILYGSFIVFATYFALYTIPSDVSFFMKSFLTSCCTLFVLVQYVWFYKILWIFWVKVVQGGTNKSGKDRRRRDLAAKKEL
mmetsp:Transcript_3107/g.11898  ORF Transcript_3107/g.11898 Transcript_3107/m.11898 type:complete len:324 (+) Transcript_3107:229-1200(+)